eukprot:6063051-Prymnesium_polylepis.1
MRTHLLRPLRADLALLAGYDQTIPGELQPCAVARDARESRERDSRPRDRREGDEPGPLPLANRGRAPEAQRLHNHRDRSARARLFPLCASAHAPPPEAGVVCDRVVIIRHHPSSSVIIRTSRATTRAPAAPQEVRVAYAGRRGVGRHH